MLLSQAIIEHLGAGFADEARFLDDVLADYPSEPLIAGCWRVLGAARVNFEAHGPLLMVRGSGGQPGAPNILLVDLRTQSLSLCRDGERLGLIEWGGKRVRFRR